MRIISICIAIAIPWLANAQINTYPYTESFEDPFTMGHSVYFLPNWWGNFVAVDSMGQYDGFAQAGTHSLYMIPEGEEFKTIAQVNLDLSERFNNIAEFWVASRKNGESEDQKRVKLNVAISTNGGTTFPFVTRFGPHEGFPNENTAFQKFTFVFPPTTNDQSQVVLRFIGKSGGGPHLPGILLLDDVTVFQAEEDIFPPYLVGEELSIKTASALTIPFSEPLQPDSALLLSHYNFQWPEEEDGTPIVGEGPLPQIAAIALSSEGNSVTLTLDSPLSIGETYALEMYNITDLNENAADTLLIDAIVFNIPKPGSLVFSEILFADPSPSFPKEKLQFIELYNPTNEVVPLGGLRIKGAVSAHNLPNIKLQPGEYWVATRNAESYYATFGIPAWEWKGSWIEYDSEEGEELEPQSLYIQSTDRHSGELVDSIGFDFNDADWLALKKLGYSIEVCNKLSDNTNVVNWSLVDDNKEPFIYIFDGYQYSIYATPGMGCINSATPVVSLGTDGNYCGIEELTLDAQNEGSNYLWSTGETTQTISITQSGTYSVLVNNGSGVASDEITVSLVPGIQAEFENLPTTVCASIDLQFSNATENSVSWLWSFGDGKTSLQENPTHKYSQSGSYEVTLKAFNGFGCSDEANATIQVLENSVSFDIPDLICANQSIEFTDNSLSGNQWAWHFGDGSSSTSQNPTHVYANEGAYMVSLTVLNDHGCTATKNKQLNVKSNQIDWVLPSGPLCTYMDVLFTDNSPGAKQWTWDFGDGSGSIEPSTSHIYTNPGKYKIQLTVVNANGCTSELTEDLSIGICVGTEKVLSDQDFAIYPNPNNGTMMIRTKKGSSVPVGITIFTLKGDLVFSQTIPGGLSDTCHIDASALPDGFYFIRIQQQNELTIKKLIVRK